MERLPVESSEAFAGGLPFPAAHCTESRRGHVERPFQRAHPELRPRPHRYEPVLADDTRPRSEAGVRVGHCLRSSAPRGARLDWILVVRELSAPGSALNRGTAPFAGAVPLPQRSALEAVTPR